MSGRASLRLQHLGVHRWLGDGLERSVGVGGGWVWVWVWGVGRVWRVVVMLGVQSSMVSGQ